MNEGTERHIVSMLRQVVSEDPEQRSLGADSTTDLVQEYSDPESFTVTLVLACLVESEKDKGAQEAQLHALAEFAEHDALPRFALLRVLEANLTPLTPSAQEHLDYLTEVAER